MNIIKSFDIYKKLPSDLVEPTFSGTLCKFSYNFNYFIKKYLFLQVLSLFFFH